jgi:hypothetical protein
MTSEIVDVAAIASKSSQIVLRDKESGRYYYATASKAPEEMHSSAQAYLRSLKRTVVDPDTFFIRKEDHFTEIKGAEEDTELFIKNRLSPRMHGFLPHPRHGRA